MEDQKIPAFEYILYQLNNWYKEYFPENKCNDISILKAMKLLFFVASINIPKNNNHLRDLLDIFNNFQAWTYGPVEADIYKHYRDFPNVKVDRYSLEISNEIDIRQWAINNPDLTERINNSINALRAENEDIISYGAFTLVDISHYYSSWNFYYNILEESYTPMDPEIIRNEQRYFRTNTI